MTSRLISGKRYVALLISIVLFFMSCKKEVTPIKSATLIGKWKRIAKIQTYSSTGSSDTLEDFKDIAIYHHFYDNGNYFEYSVNTGGKQFMQMNTFDVVYDTLIVYPKTGSHMKYRFNYTMTQMTIELQKTWDGYTYYTFVKAE